MLFLWQGISLRRNHNCCYQKLTRFASLLACFLLLSCQHETLPFHDDLNRLPTHVDGASDAAIMVLQNRLIKEGVQVVTMGQDYLISIPSNFLFVTHSPKLTWNSYKLLNEVICYLQQFRKVTVSVYAYSFKHVSTRREHALTLARARGVADYLWSQGIESRFIFTQGLGSDKPISAFIQDKDDVLNARIEITFRRAIV